MANCLIKCNYNKTKTADTSLISSSSFSRNAEVTLGTYTFSSIKPAEIYMSFSASCRYPSDSKTVRLRAVLNLKDGTSIDVGECYKSQTGTTLTDSKTINISAYANKAISITGYMYTTYASDGIASVSSGIKLTKTSHKMRRLIIR